MHAYGEERRVGVTGVDRTKTIYPLTSLRFFLALYVVVQHTLGPFVPALISDEVLDHGLGRLIFTPAISVSFFFLLSGYVLSLVYLRPGQRVEKRRFFAARFARVYPLFLLTLVMDTPKLLMERAATQGKMVALTKTAITFAAHLVMLHAWWPRRLVGINPPNWSLSVETFLYLCFPMLGVLLWRLRGLGIWVAAVSFYIGGQALVWLVRPYISHQTAMLLPPLHLSTFALGVLLARWQAARRERGMTSEPCAWQADGILVVAIVALMLALGSSLLRPWSYLFFDGLLAPIFMGIVWALSSARAMASRLLSMRWLVVLGESSYALYLIHDPLLHLFQHFHLEKRPMLYPVYLALCIGLSVLSFFYFETPSRAWLLKRLQTRSLESVEAASMAQ